MADTARKLAIDALIKLKNYYTDRDIDSYVGFDERDVEVINFAISDMRRAEELEIEVEALKTDLHFHRDGYWAIEAENKRLEKGIANAKAKVERKCIGKQFSEAVIYGMQKAVEIFDEYLGEEDKK